MRRSLLSLIAGTLLVPAGILMWQQQDLSRFFAAFAQPSGLMQGCMDVPEAVTMVEALRDRSLQIERYMESIDNRKAQLAEVEEGLRKRLTEIKTEKSNKGTRQDLQSEAVRNDIDRLIAVYDQMKPAEAAAILTNLPADFAAEILMRVQPATGARIIAAVEPRQAAALTAHMGARNIRSQ